MRSLLAAAAAATLLLPVGVASAATSTVGLAPALLADNANFGAGYYTSVTGGYVLGNTGTASPATAAGTLTQWQVRPRMAGGTMRVAVLHPDGSGGWTIAAVGAAEVPTGSTVHTFSASLPIAAGDVLGVIGTGNGLRMSNTDLGAANVRTTWTASATTVGTVLGGSPSLSPGSPFAVSGTVTTADPVVVAPPADPAPAPANPAPAPALPAIVSVATRAQVGTVAVAPGARTLRVACGIDRGAIHTCTVAVMHAGKVVGTGTWSRTRQTAHAGVTVKLTREGARLVRNGARITLRVTTTVAGRTLRAEQAATIGS
jgi:hypothetical protein